MRDFSCFWVFRGSNKGIRLVSSSLLLLIYYNYLIIYCFCIIVGNLFTLGQEKKKGFEGSCIGEWIGLIYLFSWDA